ncbi:MAG: NAD(P)/FAD-dependent oxidoreductase [Methylobacteriaceae bacterium]|nr:NAD(P)/FAD-dependent oxidoreductase [Methylobacteriaceae bacterium]
MLDAVIVGGGPAGLNAALFLGRCRRSVLLVDAGQPRNARSRWVSGFLSRDGTEPAELRRLAREDVARYPSVTLREGEVTAARTLPDGFEVELADGERVRSRKLVLATGLENDCPDLPDARRFYGRGVYPCPYCDGWEHRDEPVIAYGRGRSGRAMALEMTVWTSDILLLTDGPSELSAADRHELARHRIAVEEAPVAALEGDPDGDGLARVRLADGRAIARRALFYAFEACRTPPLAHMLGCDLGETGAVKTGPGERTNVPGLFVAGDASRRVKFAIVAAGEGAMAAFALNTELLQDDLRRRRTKGDPEQDAA